MSSELPDIPVTRIRCHVCVYLLGNLEHWRGFERLLRQEDWSDEMRWLVDRGLVTKKPNFNSAMWMLS